MGGTATGSGGDYQLSINGVNQGASGTISIPVGASQLAFALKLINDGNPDVDKTAVINLTNLVNVNPGATTQFTQTIVDVVSPPTAGFAAASSSGLESVVNASIPVTLSRVSTQTVTVDYAVTGGTAVGGGVDYTLSSGTLTFPPGTTTQNIPLTVVDDTIVEPSETVVIGLSNFVNATAGGVTHTYTIIDNDANDLVLNGAGGSTLNGVAINTCGGGSTCNAANPYIISADTTFSSVTMTNGAVMRGSAWTSGVPAPGNGILRFEVSGNLSVDSTSLIQMNGLGYTAANGPGTGVLANNTGSGGAYGGESGWSSQGAAGALPYGDLVNPVDPGSGGGNAGCCGAGGTGGGAILIAVYGTLTLNGTISTNGTAATSQAGGGAGGAVNITSGVFGGSTGSLSNGGAVGSVGIGGGGSGGRISITYTTDAFSGGIGNLVTNAFGGLSGTQSGAAGTVFLKQLGVNANGRLLVDNNGVSVLVTTRLIQNYTFDVLTLEESGESRDQVRNSLLATTTNYVNSPAITNFGTWSDSISNIAGYTLHNYGAVSFPGGNITIGAGGTLDWGLPTLSATGITVLAGGTLTHPANTNLQTYVPTSR